MNLEDLKTSWSELDRKLSTTQLIQEKIIISLITTRSSDRFSSVRKNYRLGLIWMIVCFLIGIVIITTNPFDYIFLLQYLPVAMYSVCLLILTIGLFTKYLHLNRIVIDHKSVASSLRGIILEYERPRKFLTYTLIVFLLTAIFFPLSFLPRQVDKMGWGLALAERLIPMSISALLLFVAYKLGAFKERHVDKFKEDLNELNQLKKLSQELIAE
jgi:hypothetical protein